jgi:mannan endo-1,4-beta-mannosidase
LLVESSQFIDAKVPGAGFTQARSVRGSLVLLAAVLALLGYRGVSMGLTPASRATPWKVAPPPSARVDVGVTTTPLARNEWRVWQPSDLASVDSFEHLARKHLSVVMWYSDWEHNSLSVEQLRAIANRGSLPEITWEPWDFSKGPYHPQPKYTLQSIIDGSHDAYIRSWARALAAYGKPVRLRLAQEMNGNWYPWAEGVNGNRRGQFVEAWRHVHDLFRAAGADNVQWVWSPVAIAGSITAEQYPGNAYVDMIGLSLFNGGAQLKYNKWESFAVKVGPSLRAVKKIAPHEPIEISEVGVAERGGSKAQWISGMFQTLKAHPEIDSVIWFDVHTSSDWRIESSRSAEAAFAAGVSNPRYR